MSPTFNGIGPETRFYYTLKNSYGVVSRENEQPIGDPGCLALVQRIIKLL